MGGLISSIFGGGSSDGQQQQMGALKAARGDIQAYRPEAMQARLNALGNMTSAFQGANNALETLWGAPPQQRGNGLKLPEKPPQRMMGHDLPQQPMLLQPQAPMPQRAPLASQFNPLDPLGLFGGK